MRQAKAILWTDFLIFGAFLVSAGLGLCFTYASFPDPHGGPWSSIHIHSGMFVLAGVVLHLLLHKKWIRTTVNMLLNKASWPARINFCLDCLLGGVFILVCLSGLNRWLDSAGYVTFLHIKLSFWEAMHRGTGTAMVAYVLIHLGLHWRFLWNFIKKSFIFQPHPKGSQGFSEVS